MDFDANWCRIQVLIDKALDMLSDIHNKKGCLELKISKKEYMETYTLIYNLACQKDTNHGERLY